ncbi:MAG: aldolase/citrate lyase family protein [Chloroflexota bacterium]
MLNKKLAAGEAIIGTWVSLADPSVVEVLAQTGFDFLLIDGEHSPIDDNVLKHLLIAAKGYETAVIFRVRANQEPLIKMALDLGVDGVMVPMVCSAEEAKTAVNATRYPPFGKRGIGPWRASNYYDQMQEYMASANDNISLWLQVEHVDAVANLDEILAVDGFDVAFIGPADLSASLGVYPDTTHPDALATFAKVMSKCAAVGKPVGFDASSPAHIAQLRKQGVQVFSIGGDVGYLQEGARALSAAARGVL